MIYFVTENFLETETPITANTQLADVYPLVKSTSDMFVRDLLGTYFYDYLLGKYNNSTLSANEAELVSIIQYCIAWRVASKSALALSYQITSKGVQSQNGDFSSSVDKGNILYLVKEYDGYAVFYENRLIKYLVNNKSLYAEFLSDSNNDSNIKEKYMNGGVRPNYSIFTI